MTRLAGKRAEVDRKQMLGFRGRSSNDRTSKTNWQVREDQSPRADRTGLVQSKENKAYKDWFRGWGHKQT